MTRQLNGRKKKFKESINASLFCRSSTPSTNDWLYADVFYRSISGNISCTSRKISDWRVFISCILSRSCFCISSIISSLWNKYPGLCHHHINSLWSFSFLSFGNFFYRSYGKKNAYLGRRGAHIYTRIFFGVGFLILSSLQQSYPTLYREIQAYLFGQAATMTSMHVYIYGSFAILVVGVIIFFFKPIQAVVFDPLFADISGLPRKKIEQLLFILLVVAIVIGIRSVGVVLISSMLIFPAVCARHCTSTLASLLLGASLFGLLSGYFGVYFSHEASMYFYVHHGKILSFPTGPMIVLFANTLFFIVLLFSPKLGLLPRIVRSCSFSWQCDQENLLKMLWKQQKKHFSFDDIAKHAHIQGMRLHLLLWRMERKGWIKSHGDTFELTYVGMLWGRKIVRLHRLWEVYLVECCRLPKDRVHPNAEEMEHIITPEIEKELLHILGHPLTDPHDQPIPQPEEPFLKSAL